MAINYNLEMEKIISLIKKQEDKPRLLLHSCCAPCSSACIERLKDFFEITIYYYNPNLDSYEEYALRSSEQLRLSKEFGVNCEIEDYSKQDFYSAINGLENCPEGGERCSVCFGIRLDKTAKYAKKNGFDYFATTLTISPLKNAEKLNEIGNALAQKHGVKFLPSDFKKKGGYLRSIELSKEFSLYRQNYCGCEFSKEKNPT